MDRAPGVTPLQRRINRWLIVGAWSARHWRGLLLSIYVAMIGLFAAIAWLGASRDNAFALGVGIAAGLALLLRFPRRLVASMRRESRARRMERAANNPSRPRLRK